MFESHILVNLHLAVLRMDEGPFSCLSWALNQQGLKLTLNAKPSLESTQQWDAFFFFFFEQDLFVFTSISPRWTLVSLILFITTLRSTSLTSFWKLWVSLIGAHMTVLCAVMSCRLASWMTPWLMTDAKTWPSKKTKTSYLYTLMPTLRVWVVFSCLSEEDDSALRHGTVFIVIKTGFMTNNERRLRGHVKTLLPFERLSSHNACVFYTSLWGVHIIVVYILEFIMLERK